MTNLICDYILTTKNTANQQCFENVYSFVVVVVVDIERYFARFYLFILLLW